MPGWKVRLRVALREGVREEAKLTVEVKLSSRTNLRVEDLAAEAPLVTLMARSLLRMVRVSWASRLRFLMVPSGRMVSWVPVEAAGLKPVHGAAHGFVAGRSILTNALAHRGADVLVKVDVKDFFPSVTWRRVKGLLRKGGLEEHAATLLSLLSTEAPREVVQFRGKTLYVAKGPRSLPQGAPTSPAITNALCLKLDKRVSAMAKRLGFTYTRYADDLTFSWRRAKGARGRRRRTRRWRCCWRG